MSAKDKIHMDDLPPRKRRELLGMEPVGEMKPKKRHKYNVGPKADRTCDGIVFDSIREMKRYNELRLMEQAGEIYSLERQPRFPLHVNDIQIGEYVADFVYFNGNAYVYEDVKGGNATKTPLYRWKKKHVLAEYGVEIRET